MRYRPETEVILKDLSFTITEGEKIGIIGRTGSGKSTISLAMTRIVEIENGEILIDGKNIKDQSLKSLRNLITIVSQDAIIFNASIRFNLDPNDQHTDS